MEQKQEDFEIPIKIIKLLCDKSNDKRKSGVKELDSFLRSCIKFTSEDSIYIAIFAFKNLGEVIQPQNIRRASFLGLTTLAIIIKQSELNESIKEKIPGLVESILDNILSSFRDNEAKVVYSAAECLYNMMKYFGHLVILFFNDIFEGLLLLNVNPDIDVRTIAQNLDSLLKEIVNFSILDNKLPSEFNLTDFFKRIYEKINAKHPSVRIMIISWIIFINSIPEIKIINVLPDFLGCLLDMLAEKRKEVAELSEKCLKDILKELDIHFDTLTYEVEVRILEILIEKGFSGDMLLVTLFEWINLFLSKYKYILIGNKKLKSPYTKSIAITNKHSSNFHRAQGISSASVFNSVLDQPFELRSEDFTYCYSVCDPERKIPYDLFPKVLSLIVTSIENANLDIKKTANEANTELLSIVEFYSENNYSKVKLFEPVLRKHSNLEEKESTLQLVIQWVGKLFKKFHDELFTKMEEFIEDLVSILSHHNESLFSSVLEIICEIAKHKEENVEVILTIIIHNLSRNRNLLSSKGLILIKRFCVLIPVDKVYSTAADVLSKMRSSEFVARMINILNLFLVTGSETEALRSLLRNAKKDKHFFERLFRSWAMNPVSCLILCLLSEFYELSNFLLIKLYYKLLIFSGSLHLCNESYVELAQLVQLLESPVFIHIRVSLLQPSQNTYLVKSLFGVLLMLPQGKAYQALYRRLKHVEVIYKLDKLNTVSTKITNPCGMDEIERFLFIFEEAQNCKLE